jgi:hypothetical protein
MGSILLPGGWRGLSAPRAFFAIDWRDQLAQSSLVMSREPVLWSHGMVWFWFIATM